MVKEWVTGKAANYDVRMWSRVAVWNRGWGLGLELEREWADPSDVDGVVRSEVK